MKDKERCYIRCVARLVICRTSWSFLNQTRHAFFLQVSKVSGVHRGMHVWWQTSYAKTCIKCDHLNYMDYKYLPGCNDEPWYCLSCTNTLFSFGILNNQNFLNFNGNNNAITSSETKNLNSSLLLKKNPDLALFLINLIMPFLKTTVIQKM